MCVSGLVGKSVCQLSSIMKFNYLDFISASEKLREDFHKRYKGNLERCYAHFVASVKLSGSCGLDTVHVDNPLT